MRLFILSLLLFCSFPSFARLVERVQAQVADEMISLMDLKAFQKRLKAGLVPPSLLLTQLFKKQELLKEKNKLLDFMIYRSFLAQIAEKKPLQEIPEQQVKEVLDLLKGNFSTKNFSRKLARAGISLSDLKKEILIDLKNDLLLNQFVSSKIIISEQDVESFHFHKYNKPLFKSFEYEFVSASFPEEKKEDFLEKLSRKSIKNLEKTALSLGMEYKILKLKQQELQKDFQKELDKLSISQVSPLLLSGKSYYLLQLKWKSPLVSSKDAKKKLDIEQTLYKKQLKEKIAKWIEDKKKDFSIRRHPL